MTKNAGNLDRGGRVVLAVVLALGAVFAPWPLVVGVAALALPGVYLFVSALAGTCLGHRLMERSTCPVNR